MSWDVIVTRAADGLRTELPLGPLRDVQERVLAQLPEIENRVGDRIWHYRYPNFGIEFDFGSDDPVRNVWLHVVGFGDPISALVRLARPNGWVLIDCADGRPLDLDRPSYDGWVAWQLFAYGKDPRVVKVSRPGGPRVMRLKYPPEPANVPLFAEGIVGIAREGGDTTLDHSLASLAAVEAMIDRFRADGDTFRFLAETVFGFGCYVGEVVRREAGGDWVPVREAPGGATDFPLALRLGPAGPFVDPINRVALRLERGASVSLLDWAREVGPGGPVDHRSGEI
jgi:hypothetical protein